MSKDFNAGTWFFSYLCEAGFIENDDTIEHNYVTGRVTKSIWGIPEGYYVYAMMNKDLTIDVTYAKREDVDKYQTGLDKFYEEDYDPGDGYVEEHGDDYYENEDSWYEKPFSMKKRVTVRMDFEEIK